MELKLCLSSASLSSYGRRGLYFKMKFVSSTSVVYGDDADCETTTGKFVPWRNL